MNSPANSAAVAVPADRVITTKRRIVTNLGTDLENLKEIEGGFAELVAIINDSNLAREINFLKYHLLLEPDDELVKELLARHQAMLNAKRQTALKRLARIEADVAMYEANLRGAEADLQRTIQAHRNFRRQHSGSDDEDEAVGGATPEADPRFKQAVTHGKDETDQFASTVRLSLILYRTSGHSKKRDNWWLSRAT